MVAIIVRLAISDRENRRLLEQVRTDPLTGLASRGALQIDLEGICAKATEKEPISILLFDLNGFKSYNDTCGHPAGDELLAELGGRLNAVVAGAGTAYRIGGDEFCVVLSGDGETLDELHARGGDRADHAQERRRRQRRLGLGLDPGRSRHLARGDAARRRAHVRAEGGTARRPAGGTGGAAARAAGGDGAAPAAEQPLDSSTVDA